MEALFENSYVRNKELVKELYRYFYLHRKLLFISYVLLFVGFIANLLLYILGNEINLVAVIMVPSLYLFQFLRYLLQVNAVVKRDKEVFGDGITVDTVVTEESIQVTASNGAVNKLEYINVKKAVSTKNLILLRTKANLVYILKKDSFTKGTSDEFITFLKSKGIKVK